MRVAVLIVALLASLAGCGSPDSAGGAAAELAVACDRTECYGATDRCVTAQSDFLLPEAGCFYRDFSLGPLCWEKATCVEGEFYALDSDDRLYRIVGCVNTDPLDLRRLAVVPGFDASTLLTECTVLEDELEPFCSRFGADTCPVNEGCGLRIRLQSEIDSETGCERIENRNVCEVVLPGDTRPNIVLPSSTTICPPGVEGPACTALCGTR